MALHYEVHALTRDGGERVYNYAADGRLAPGSVIIVKGRWWLLERVEEGAEGGARQAIAKPARYRLRMRHPDGREQVGAFRRFRPDGPRLGHAFTTLEEGEPVTWSVVEERLERDEAGEPYIDLVAERDFSELEELPDHELEHALARVEDEFPEGAVAALSRAEEAGRAAELVALEAGEEPDWAAAERFIDALVLAEVEDDLLQLCGVRGSDPEDTWLEKVKERLRSDLERFRADVEGDHFEIEEWDFLGGRVFAAVGSFDDEANPDSGLGWMVRLLDSEALGAAGFDRIKKAEIV
jgi:hypothetical protein